MLVTIVFIVCVMSFGRYEISRLVPYFAFPIVLVVAARVPARLVLQKALLVLPVALLIGLPNPLFDREPLTRIGDMTVSGGWVSMGSIVLRALLAAIASIVLVAVTGFPAICGALERLGMPRPLAVQLLFLYRYLGVLGEEAMRMDYAHDLRSNGHSLSIRTVRDAGRPPVAAHLGSRGADLPRDVREGIHRRLSRRRGDPVRLAGVHVRPRLDRVVPAAAHPGPFATARVGRARWNTVSHHLVEAIGLTHVYDDGTPALHDVSFRITHGESVGIIGANGAGKSTLLMHLNGHLTPTRGEVRIGEMPLTRATLPQIRRTVGLVFQDPDDQLFMPTVFDDVAFGPRNQGLPEADVERRVQDALQCVGVWSVRARPPYRLSGGEKKRVAIAGVLAMSPDILVMDEPTSGLDPRARRQLIGLLREFSHTRIFTSHDLDMVLDLCPRTIVLCDGAIAADGPTRAILTDDVLLERCKLERPLSLQAARA